MDAGRVRWLIAAAAFAVLQGPAFATDFSIADKDYQPLANGWAIAVAPYGWAPGIVGDLAVRGYNVHTSVTFSQLIENADRVIPAMGYVELKNGRFSVFGDAVYVQLGFSRSDSVQFDPIAELKIKLSAKASLLATLEIAQAGAAYEVAHWQQSETASSALDLYAGARYWYTSAALTLDTKESIDLTRFGWKRVARQSFRVSDDFHWVDPVIGMRIRQQLAPGHEIDFAGDVGGFGVGSNFSWQIFGGYTRSFQCGNGLVAASLGYRVLGVNYDGGSGKNAWGLDTIMHGPLASLSFRW